VETVPFLESQPRTVHGAAKLFAIDASQIGTVLSMSRLLQKTVNAKLFALTRTKEQKISREYWNFQKALHGEDVLLYSATKQQAKRKKAWNGDCEYPLVLRRDCFGVKKLGLKVAKWWTKIPVYGGSIYCPIELPYMQEQLLKEDIRETQLVRRRKGWFLHRFSGGAHSDQFTCHCKLFCHIFHSQFY
jgi:hypothetical protein